MTDSVHNSLAPSLLVSMPQLNDPNFHRSVILLCEHDEEGAFGLVLNRPTDTPPASEVIRLTPPGDIESGLELWIGGPVEPERGWILTGAEPTDVESVRVYDGVYLSTSQSLLRRLLENPPPRTRLLIGYAGWDAGQLDAELSASAWLTSEIDLDIIFDTQATEMWEAAIRRLGVDPALLQMGSGEVH